MSDAERRRAEADAVFRALAHPSRRHILLVLRFRGGRMTAGEIAERFGCSWPTTSRHLNVLKSAALVLDERRGRERVYRLADEHLLATTHEFTRWFEGSPETATPPVYPPGAARRGRAPKGAGRARR